MRARFFVGVACAVSVVLTGCGTSSPATGNQSPSSFAAPTPALPPTTSTFVPPVAPASVQAQLEQGGYAFIGGEAQWSDLNRVVQIQYYTATPTVRVTISDYSIQGTFLVEAVSVRLTHFDSLSLLWCSPSNNTDVGEAIVEATMAEGFLIQGVEISLPNQSGVSTIQLPPPYKCYVE